MSLKAWEPRNNILYDKIVKHRRSVVCTSENNGYLIWLGVCIDPPGEHHEHSEWEWSIIGWEFLSNKAIEVAVKTAMKLEVENEAQD